MRHYLLAALLVLSAMPASGQPTVVVPPNVRVEGVPPIPQAVLDGILPYGQFRQARLHAWHPSERRVLIATAFGNAPQIHDVRGPGAARRQLTFFPQGIARTSDRAAWFGPAGRYILLRSDAGGGTESMQLVRYDPDSGAQTLLTDGRSRNGIPSWSHDGRRIAFDSTARNGKDRDLYVMDPLEPSSLRLLAETSGAWEVLDWSPDARELLAAEMVSATSETYLWRIDVATGKKRAMTSRESGKELWTTARYGADGRSVFALGNRDAEDLRLWRIDLHTGSAALVGPPTEGIEEFALSPDGGLVAVVVTRRASNELRIVDTASGRLRLAPALPTGIVTGLAWRPSGDELGFNLAGGRMFSDVYSVRVKDGAVERWTFSEIGGANPDSLPDAEVVEWESFDGLRVPGVLYREAPRFAGRRPVIVNVHGGPADIERPRGLGRMNYFRNELGIAVIYPNVRGSGGLGRTYEQLDNVMRREDAVRDIGALLDWLAAQPWVDSDRIMITGASYGGYITLASAIAYGDRLRCAFPAFAISDFVAFLEATEESRRADRRLEYGDPSDPETRAFLTRISPLTQASKLRIPLLVAQGGKDTRVPVAQADALVRAVRENGTPVWYIVYEDAGHLQLTNVTNDFNSAVWVAFVKEFLLR